MFYSEAEFVFVIVDCVCHDLCNFRNPTAQGFFQRVCQDLSIAPGPDQDPWPQCCSRSTGPPSSPTGSLALFCGVSFFMKFLPVFGGARRIRGDLLRNVLSFENEEIWRRSCKLWTKVLLVFSCRQTHCLWQPRSFSFYLSIFFRSDFFFRAHYWGIILSWMSGLCCNPLSSPFQIYYIALYALVPVKTHFNIVKFNAL